MLFKPELDGMSLKKRQLVRNKIMENWLMEEGYDPSVITPKGFKQMDELDRIIVMDGWKAVAKLVPLK